MEMQLLFPTTQSDISNPINKTDNSIDAGKWKSGTTLIVGDSITAALREVKLSSIRKV